MYAKCSVDTEGLILITTDSQQPREGKGYSHFDWRYVRWLQLEPWSPDFWSVLRRTVVVTVILLPAQLFLVQHNTVTSCSRPRREGQLLGCAGSVLPGPPLRTRLSGGLSCRYLKHTLDQYVESDYTLLYLHHGLTSDNKPSFSWLRDAYREFDRKWVGASGEAPGPLGGQPLGPIMGCPLLRQECVLHAWGRWVPPQPG